MSLLLFCSTFIPLQAQSSSFTLGSVNYTTDEGCLFGGIIQNPIAIGPGTPYVSVAYNWLVDGQYIDNTTNTNLPLGTVSSNGTVMNCNLYSLPMGVLHQVKVVRTLVSNSGPVVVSTISSGTFLHPNCIDDYAVCAHDSWNYSSNGNNATFQFLSDAVSISINFGNGLIISGSPNASANASIIANPNGLTVSGTVANPTIGYGTTGITSFTVVATYTQQTGTTSACSKQITVGTLPQVALFDMNVTNSCNGVNNVVSCIGPYQKPTDTYQWSVNGVVVQSGAGQSNATFNTVLTNINAYTNPQAIVSLQYNSDGSVFNGQQVIMLTPGIHVGTAGMTTNLTTLINSGLFGATGYNGQITLPGATTLSASRIYISGVLNINTGATFQVRNSDFLMSPGSEIAVSTGATNNTNSRFLFCSFQAACPQMWKGITVNDQQTLTINNNPFLAISNGNYYNQSKFIRDAHFGIEIVNRANLILNTIDFNRDYIGLYVTDRTQSRAVTNTLRNLNFNCLNNAGTALGTLLPNYVGQPATGNYTFAGAVLRDVNNIRFDEVETAAIPVGSTNAALGTNIFNFVAHGILAHNVGALNISGTAFYNIGAQDGQTVQNIDNVTFNYNFGGQQIAVFINGTAVFHENDQGITGTLTFTGLRDINPTYHATFVNTNHGIYFGRVDAFISNCEFIRGNGAAQTVPGTWWANANNNTQIYAIWSRNSKINSNIVIQNNRIGYRITANADGTPSAGFPTGVSSHQGYERGITILGLSGDQGSFADISNNEIQCLRTSLPGFINSNFSHGITVESAAAGSLAEVRINNNHLSERVHGIRVRNLNNAEILDNVVQTFGDVTDINGTETSNDIFRTGISVENCPNSVLSCNEVIGSWNGPWNLIPANPAPNLSGFVHAGYFISASPNATVSCNTTNHIRTGFYYVGASTASIFRTNTMRNHIRGLWIGASGVMGLQGSVDNNLNGQSNSNHWVNRSPLDVAGNPPLATSQEAFLQFQAGASDPLKATAINANRFVVQSAPSFPPLTTGTNQNTPLTTLCYYPLSSNSGALTNLGVWPNRPLTSIGLSAGTWFDNPTTCAGTICPANACTNFTPQPLVPGNNDSLAIQIVNGGTATTMFPYQIADQIKEHLYERFESQDQYEIDPALSQFVSDQSNTPTGMLKGVKDMQREGYTQNNELDLNINSLLDQMKPYEDALAMNDADAQSYIEAQTMLDGLAESIQVLLEQKQAEYLLIVAESKDRMAIAELDNSSFIPEKEIHMVSQMVNQIYHQNQLSENNVYSEEQASTLLLLSGLCPLVSGEGVFQARAMYAMIDPVISFNDELICGNLGMNMRIMKEPLISPEIQLQLTPNPGNGEVYVSKHTGVGFLLVRDIVGQEVMERVIIYNEEPAFLQLNDLPKGVYLIQQIDEQNKVVATSKYVKI
jgi:hypothetical protein